MIVAYLSGTTFARSPTSAAASTTTVNANSEVFQPGFTVYAGAVAGGAMTV